MIGIFLIAFDAVALLISLQSMGQEESSKTYDGCLVLKSMNLIRVKVRSDT